METKKNHIVCCNGKAIEKIGAPRATRTPDLRIRSPTLYPSELWALDLSGLLGCLNSHLVSHITSSL
jgi:hypothetical protein